MEKSGHGTYPLQVRDTAVITPPTSYLTNKILIPNPRCVHKKGKQENRRGYKVPCGFFAGRSCATRREPPLEGPYVSVFIEHFFNSPVQNPEILRKLYLDFGLTQREISEITQDLWSRAAISEALTALGLTRPPTPSRLKYGQRLMGGKAVPNAREQKILALMRDFIQEGHTPYGVAKILNGRSIPGKLGGKWDKTTVRDILKRETTT